MSTNMLVYLLYTDTTYVLTRESHGSQPEATDNKREEKFLAKLVGDQCEKSHHRDGPHSFPVAPSRSELAAMHQLSKKAWELSLSLTLS